MTKVYKNDGASIKQQSDIRVPRVLDLPMLVGDGGKFEMRQFMGCDSFSVMGALGGPTEEEATRDAIVVQMCLGESGLFNVLSLAEAEELRDQLDNIVTSIKEKGMEGLLEGKQEMEANEEEGENDA